MKKLLAIMIAAVCVAVAVFLGWHLFSSRDVSDHHMLKNFIVQIDGAEKVDILGTKAQGEFLAVYYDDGTEDRLMILEQDNIFKNRYEYFGGASSSEDIDTFNFGQSNQWALIVVYGDNTKLKAASYAFDNNGETYRSQQLGEYLLDIYKIEDTTSPSSAFALYDKYGEKMAVY